MALNGTVMGDAVVAAIQGVDGSMTADQIAQLKTSWEAICGAIVAHIQANAVVLPDTLNNPAGQAVQVNPTSGSGATVAPQVIAGTGKVN